MFAFGLRVASEIEPPWRWSDAGTPDVVLRASDEVPAASSGPCDPPAVSERLVDGDRVTIERGQAGDVLVSCGDHSSFLVGQIASTPVSPGSAPAELAQALVREATA